MFCVRDKKKLCVCRPGVVVCMPLIPAVYSNLIQDSESKPISQKKKKNPSDSAYQIWCS